MSRKNTQATWRSFFRRRDHTLRQGRCHPVRHIAIVLNKLQLTARAHPHRFPNGIAMDGVDTSKFAAQTSAVADEEDPGQTSAEGQARFTLLQQPASRAPQIRASVRRRPRRWTLPRAEHRAAGLRSRARRGRSAGGTRGNSTRTEE